MAHMRTVEAMLFALLEPRNSSPESNIPPRWEEAISYQWLFNYERDQNTVQTHIYFKMCLAFDIIFLCCNYLKSVTIHEMTFPPSCLPSQSFEHDAYCCGTSLWTHGGRVADQWSTDRATADDWVGDTEASQDKLPPRAVGKVQELFPDGQQKRRRGTLWCSASGCCFLRAAQRIFQLATTCADLMPEPCTTSTKTNLSGILPFTKHLLLDQIWWWLMVHLKYWTFLLLHKTLLIPFFLFFGGEEGMLRARGLLQCYCCCWSSSIWTLA